MSEKRRALLPLQREIHENAVAHGWWDDPRCWPEIRILVVTEIAEAMEDFRAGRMEMVPFGKPEGFPIELADVAIRLFDYAEYRGFHWDADDEAEIHKGLSGIVIRGVKDIPSQLDSLVACLYDDCAEDEGTVWRALCGVFDIAERHHIDLLAAIDIKHAYNKTRPYRHGGKKA